MKLANHFSTPGLGDVLGFASNGVVTIRHVKELAHSNAEVELARGILSQRHKTEHHMTLRSVAPRQHKFVEVDGGVIRHGTQMVLEFRVHHILLILEQTSRTAVRCRPDR